MTPQKTTAPSAKPLSLVDVAIGKRVTVLAVNAASVQVNKLAAIGILPGVDLVVQQQEPVVVVELYEAVFALERELALGVLVSGEHAVSPSMAGIACAVAGLGICFVLGCTGGPSTRPSASTGGEVAGIAQVHKSRCGQCHRRVEPGTRTRAQLEPALARHHSRVRLNDAQWAALVDYLADRT